MVKYALKSLIIKEDFMQIKSNEMFEEFYDWRFLKKLILNGYIRK